MAQDDNFRDSEAMDVFFRNVQKAHNRNGFEMRQKSPLRKKGKLGGLVKKGVNAAKKAIKDNTSKKALKGHAQKALEGAVRGGARKNFSAAERSAADASRKPKSYSVGKTFDISESRKSKKSKKKLKQWKSKEPKKMTEQEKFLAMDKANKGKSPAKSINRTRRGAGVAGVYKARRRAATKPYKSFADVARKPKRKSK